jgi:transcriptional regulator of acetoin/glycerol metabolism
MTALRILLVLDAVDAPLAPLAELLRARDHQVIVADPTAAEVLLGPGSSAFDAVIRTPGHGIAAPTPLDAAEKRHIAATLSHTRGNKRQAAHLLGIARSTLLAKVRKYQL